MASTMTRDSYTFRAEPKAVKSRPKYRKQDASQRQALGNSNLMSDKRVMRGNTYSRKPQPKVMEKAPIRPHTPTRKRVPQQELIMRVPTPEPVAGRQHMSIQTDNYLEDLRERTREHDFGTQTDPELDYPEKPLFVPQSSGVDMFTFIEEGDLFDFDMEVEPILHVITAKSLDQALLEVFEEEEMKEMLAHREEYSQLRNAKMAELQRLEAKDKRFEEEKKRRIAQAEKRVVEQAQLAKERAARTLAKDFYMDLQNTIVSKLASSGFFFDPALKQIQGTFLPWLVKKVGDKINEQAVARKTVDRLIDGAARISQQETGQKILEIMDVIQSRETIRAEIERREREAEAARRAAEAEAAALKAAKLAAGGDDEPEDDDDDKDDEDDEDNENEGDEGDDVKQADTPKPEEKDEEPPLVMPNLSILGQAFEFGEEDARRRFRGEYGPIATASVFANIPSDLVASNEAAADILSEANLAFEEQAEKRIDGLQTDVGIEVETYPGGVYVSSVTPLGSANHATIVEGDVINTFNEADLVDQEHFDKLVARMQPGELAKLSVTRGVDGRLEIVELEAFVRDSTQTPQQLRKVRNSLSLQYGKHKIYTGQSAALKLNQSPVSFGVIATGNPITVTEVLGDCAASRSGIVEGDILVSLNGSLLQTAENINTELHGMLPGSWVKVVVDREGVHEVLDVELSTPGETIESIRSLRLMADLLEPLPSSYKGFNENTRADSNKTNVKQDPVDMAKTLKQLKALPTEFGCDLEEKNGGVCIRQVNKLLGIEAAFSEGDVVLEVDDIKLESMEHLLELVDKMIAGDVVKVKVQRALDGALDLLALEITTAVVEPKVVRELRLKAGIPVNEEPLHTEETAMEELKGTKKRLGFRIAETDDGIQITRIGGLAVQSGAVVGDIVEKINGVEVNTTTEFIEATSSTLPGDCVVLSIRRTDALNGEISNLELTTEVGSDGRRHEWVQSMRKLASLSLFSRYNS